MPLHAASPFAWQGFGVIAEIKRASPSVGAIADHPVDAWAQGLEAGGAQMLSVLTEETYFHGSLETLAQVRAHVKLPLLRKDFLVHPCELDEAVAFGANAVLLIAAMLPLHDLKLMFREARDRRLGVLLEVHEPEELEAAFACDAFTASGTMLGINQRNLQSLAVDPRYAEKFTLPAGTRFVVESGIKNKNDLVWARNLGSAGILVGEALARAPRPGVELRSWLDS